MNLELKSISQNKYPSCGFFIEGHHLDLWINVLDTMNLSMSNLQLYPLPSLHANSIWGCLVLSNDSIEAQSLGRWTAAHHISNKIIIPERTDLNVELTSFDMVKLFDEDRYVFHMDFGLFKLEEPLELVNLLDELEIQEMETTEPVSFERLSPEIKSFRIVATPDEDMEADIESIPERDSLKDQPLSLGEKLRLKMYKSFLNTSKDPNGKYNIEKFTGEGLAKLASAFGFSGDNLRDNLIRDFEDLMDRNRKEVEKLMDLLEKSPEDALKYAIPLDEHGYSRGNSTADFKMQNQGSDFSLFKNYNRNSSGASVDLGQEFFRLRQQYMRTAEALKKKGDYEKAAFVYLKLLKDYHNAAATLQEGGFFEKAAYIYLKYVKDELKAAAAYEEGKIYEKAIELYHKNGKLEKVGDLYTLQGDDRTANKVYQNLIDNYISESQYIKAALLCKSKLHDITQTQDLLLDGWKNRSHEYSCLSLYFKNIVEVDEAWHQLNYIKDHWVDSRNEVNFLKIVKSEYSLRTSNQENLRDLGYSLVSDLLQRNVISSTELLGFNREDTRLSADTMRYNINKVQRSRR